jgi:hypothetical protein
MEHWHLKALVAALSLGAVAAGAQPAATVDSSGGVVTTVPSSGVDANGNPILAPGTANSTRECTGLTGDAMTACIQAQQSGSMVSPDTGVLPSRRSGMTRGGGTGTGPGPGNSSGSTEIRDPRARRVARPAPRAPLARAAWATAATPPRPGTQVLPVRPAVQQGVPQVVRQARAPVQGRVRARVPGPARVQAPQAAPRVVPRAARPVARPVARRVALAEGPVAAADR